MLNIFQMFGWSEMDFGNLEKFIKQSDILGVEDKIYSAVEEVDKSDINNWFYYAIKINFDAIMDAVEEECPQLKRVVNREKGRFAPYINASDSSYDNFLNYIEFDSREEAVREVVNALKDKYEFELEEDECVL